MSREIKYQAWTGKKMVDVGSIEFFAFDGFYQVNNELIIKPENLRQFTGLRDRKGVEIYEGDILGGYPHGTVWVEWNEEYACFESCAYEDMEDGDGNIHKEKRGSLLANDLNDCGDKWKVLGNIYQHKHLMEAKDE